MLKIDEAVKAEIETATGRPVPDPQSRRFEAFFESLTHDHPDLARKLEDALEVTTPYPDEEAQRAARRRARIDGLVRRMFTKEVWGQRVLDRRRISFVVFFVVFGVVAAGWSVTLLRGREARTAQSASAPVTVEEAQPIPVEMGVPLEPAPALVAQVASPPPQREGGGDSSLPPYELPPYPGSVPPAPTDAYVPPSSYSADAPPAALVASLPLSEVRAVEAPALAFSEEGVEPITEDLEFLPPLETTSPAATLAESIGRNERELAPAIAANEAVGVGWEARARSTLAERPLSIRATPVILQQEDSPQTTREASSEELTDDFSSEIPQSSHAVEDDSLLAQSVTSPPWSLPSLVGDEPLSYLVPPGTLVAATLTRGLVVTEGETEQVIADSAEGWCDQTTCRPLRWIGTATATEDGRLKVQFDRAFVDGVSIAAQGIAYGNDGLEGLPAHLVDVTPTLLADLVRAGAGGIGEYTNAVSQQRTIVVDGRVVSEESLPSLLDFILGRAASTLQLPADEASVVRMAIVEAGTSLEILYLE